MEKLLKENSADLNGSKASEVLRRKLEEFIESIYYAWDEYRFERIRLYNLRQFHYPGSMESQQQRSSVNSLAPTTFGNIGRTIRSYALTRYDMDLDIFWTRLQKTLQGSKDFYGVLQDAKIQVDSLVALTWLAAAFATGCLVILPWFASSMTEFLILGIAGPLLTLGSYRLACRSYMVFADLLRSAVDLYRFELLKDLHILPPYSLDEEKRLWSNLGNLTGYGRPMPIVYRTPGSV
jgi:hypothetical protein